MANLWAFLYQTLAASVTAALLLVVKRMFLDKLSPRWQYGIWAVLAVRLLLPAGLFGRTLIPGGRVALEAVKTVLERQLTSVLSQPYGLTKVSAPLPLFPQGLPVPGSVTDVLFYVYAAGAAVSLVCFFLSYLRLRLSLGKGRAPSPEQLAALEEVCQAYHLKPPRRVVVCPWAESAFVCGPLRPVLVLPQGNTDRKVLLHELLHLKYGDVWAGVLMCALRCLHWCNPLLWYCCNRAQNDCEALCDQRVLERLEGEDRREYGKILLSMADGRYARAPGTSSMANGGANIKRRIAAIARFKRYPTGMALGSACVAVVLAAACLVGAAPARSVDLSQGSVSLAMAQARLLRPSTPAGALDTYAKAILSDNGAYLAMVTPLARQEPLAQRLEAATEYHLGLSAPPEKAEFPYIEYWEQGMEVSARTYKAEWRIYNFLKEADGSYTGLLVLDCTPWKLSSTLDNDILTLYQAVRVWPESGSWTVEPLSDWEALPSGKGSALYTTGNLPALTYAAEAGGLRVEVDYQYVLGVTHPDAQSSAIFSSAGLDSTLDPDTLFTLWYASDGGRAYDLSTGKSVSLSVSYRGLTDKEAAQDDAGAELYAHLTHTAALPSVAGDTGGSGGANSNGGAQFQSAPAALALSFYYNGETYTCIAWPEGGVS